MASVVDVCGRRRGGADEQRRRTRVAPRRALAEGLLRYRQRGWESLRGAHPDGEHDLSSTAAACPPVPGRCGACPLVRAACAAAHAYPLNGYLYITSLRPVDHQIRL